jgi:hypothetical protein
MSTTVMPPLSARAPTSIAWMGEAGLLRIELAMLADEARSPVLQR